MSSSTYLKAEGLSTGWAKPLGSKLQAESQE
jgi:hypothetical protein